jgi:hypothetical protein
MGTQEAACRKSVEGHRLYSQASMSTNAGVAARWAFITLTALRTTLRSHCDTVEV